MIRDRKSWLQGVGVGLIGAALFFYIILLLTGYNHPEKTFENYVISDEEIETRARDLGMIYLSDLILKEDISPELEDNMKND
jgi:hypothetical protein